eukprot:CCRYP_005559-RC/>CCRYP_005559-RC protein AED:0.33 eAED:0.33 QI:0/0.66/0.57/1/0.83/0.85/7/1098/978
MPRQRATLSDLLADDVLDYFRREGVSSDNPSHVVANERQAGRRRSRTRWTKDVTAAAAAAGRNATTTMEEEEKKNAPRWTTEQSTLAKSRPNRTFPRQTQTYHSNNHTRQRSIDDTRRPKPISVADAEFLRRYAEERERANSRMAPLHRTHANNIVLPLPPPHVPSPADAKLHRKHTTSSARPPTVAGSHRPGLASIDNDDWEEDDRIERRDRRKLEQRRVLPAAVSFRTNSPPTRDDDDDRAETKRGHVRPLSYLSASSESGGDKSKTDPIHNDNNNNDGRKKVESSHWKLNNNHNGDPSPLSSSNGTLKTKDGSDIHSTLWGSSILLLDSYSSPGDSEPKTSTTTMRANVWGCRRGGREEDSSEEEEERAGVALGVVVIAVVEAEEEKEDIKTNGKGTRYMLYPEERNGLAIKMGNNYSSITYSNGTKRKRKRRETVPLRLDDAMKVIWEKILSTILVLELYISNMPSLVGSLALAWSSLGVDWFKWYEETFDACHPTDYHNPLCVYPEFPGCFTCDTSRFGYQFSLHFHYFCSFVAIVLASLLIGKIIIAFPVVRDELANPTTAAPLGLLCMALEKTFGGNFGVVGMSFTFGASALQTVVAIWFIFISIVYKTLPEPSWFPNTTGLGLAAAKIFLYWSFGGYFLAGLSIVLFLMFYFVALYRIHANIKISAPVCWVQISGPAVVLYGFSIFGQPGSDEDELLLTVEENKQHFLSVHRTYFMPFMHFFYACCMISMASAVYCLSIRYKVFREKEFSPAHVGFCAPMLSHTNAMQVYRSAVKRFSLLPHDHAFKSFLYQYWTLSLISGSILVVILTWRFFEYLPYWCQIDVDDDEIPPEPEETILTKLLEKGDAKDEMNQDYVSAAVLQANESGALVRVLRDGKMKYMRSRRMPSMGFDPIMSSSQLLDERERLLQHLAYASSLQDRGGTNSFDDTLSTFYERNSSLGSSSSSLSSRRNRPNFMSFDASAMMRGGHR